MRKSIIAITLLSSLFGTVQAKDIDFSLYNDDCVKVYNENLEINGKNEINGTYLKYKGDQKIKYESIYFMPDLNMGIMINDVFYSAYDLNNENGVYTFYSKQDNDSGRSGIMYKMKDLGNEEYEFSIFKRSGRENINGVNVSKFEKAKKLNKSKKEPIFEAVFTVDKEKGEYLYEMHTQFPKVCLK